MDHYLIKSKQGYWLPNGYGYTPNKNKAGIFSAESLKLHDLDGCTLFAACAPDAKQQKPSRLQTAIAQLDTQGVRHA